MMARGSKKIGPLFPEEENQQDVKTKEEEEDHHPQEDTDPNKEPDTGMLISKYKKREPKYKTHVPHNVRIPRELRQDIDRIAKKLGIPLHKNSGFLQQFTIDALTVHVEKAKKELGLK